jgi:NAD(P)-dependent dehydrogenase (short-subunit alcohol dehydrogenase family)
MPSGGVNTASINGPRGNESLIDYAATKGAVLAFTYSLAQALQERGIRVNSVASGPVWTPLIPATLGQEKVGSLGSRVPMGRRNRSGYRLGRSRLVLTERPNCANALGGDGPQAVGAHRAEIYLRLVFRLGRPGQSAPARP